MTTRYSVSILAIGSEILDGRVLDTNSNFLATFLEERSIPLDRILTCDDELKEIIASLNFLSQRSNIILLSGGLGPTTDDLTREAVAEFCGAPLLEDAQVLEHLHKLYLSKKRELDRSNLKQALFPKGATIIANPVGTAAGFMSTQVRADGVKSYLIAMPGVPGELRQMVQTFVGPFLAEQFGAVAQSAKRAFKVFGLPESIVGERIAACNFPAEVKISYRAAFPEIHVVFRASCPESELIKVFLAAKQAVGEEYIFSEILERNLEATLHELLVSNNKTVAAAESCTGGMVGGMLTNMAGASSYFIGSAVTYSNDAKVNILGVQQSSLAQFGAVSKEVAMEMALGARKKYNADLAVSITGIAGPDGGSEAKPVGLFFVGYADAHGVEAHEYFFKSTRHRIRVYATYTALDLVRRKLCGHAIRSRNK